MVNNMGHENDRRYRIKLLAVDRPPLPEAYYGPVDFSVSMNFAIYRRTGFDRAYTFTLEEALNVLRTDLEGWPARCEPPIVVTY